MCRPVRHRAAAPVFAALVAAGKLLGCGTGDVDRDDETGTPGQTPAAAAGGQTRVELVYVDAATDTATATPATAHSSAPTPAPSPVAVAPATAGPALEAAADAEAGGDDLIGFDPDGAYTVQVGTFTDGATARRRVQELDGLGYPAYAVAHPGSGAVRVRIGYFTTRDQADRFGQRYRRDHGGSYWVAQRLDEERGE